MLFTECCYAECHYAECRYAECHYAEYCAAVVKCNNNYATAAATNIEKRKRYKRLDRSTNDLA